MSEPIRSSTAEKTGPSAKKSVIPSEQILQRIMEQTNNDLQISDLHFDKFPTPATFACWKIRFKTDMHLFTISYGSYALDQGSGDG